VAGGRQLRGAHHSLPALDLYDSPPVIALRHRLGGTPAYRQRIRILSPRHGLLHPDAKLYPHRHSLSWQNALNLREHLIPQLQQIPTAHLLLIANPLWLLVLAPILAWPHRPTISWYTEADDDWPNAHTVLDQWGWT
jgi:hypothetical protein